jgi:hypothetical protein
MDMFDYDSNDFIPSVRIYKDGKELYFSHYNRLGNELEWIKNKLNDSFKTKPNVVCSAYSTLWDATKYIFPCFFYPHIKYPGSKGKRNQSVETELNEIVIEDPFAD